MKLFWIDDAQDLVRVRVADVLAAAEGAVDNVGGRALLDGQIAGR